MGVDVEGWHSPQRAKGTVVFVAGFMTEASDNVSWRGPVVRFAESRGMAARSIRWQSKQVLDLYPLFHALNRLTTADAVKIAVLLGVGAGVMGPIGLFGAASGVLSVAAVAPLSGVLGLNPLYVLNAIAVWKGAVKAADAVGSDPRWLSGLTGPIVLVGHSLGGRVVLRAAECGAAHARGIVAMAPAIHASSLRTVAMSSFGARAALHVVHSEDDYVLSILFRLGEASFDHAVGYEGAPKDWRGVTNHPVRSSHTAYDGLCHGLLTQLVG